MIYRDIFHAIVVLDTEGIHDGYHIEISPMAYIKLLDEVLEKLCYPYLPIHVTRIFSFSKIYDVPIIVNANIPPDIDFIIHKPNKKENYT